MTIKMYQVFRILNIYKEIKELKVPAKVAYKFNRLCTDLEGHCKFYDEQVNKIIQEYADREEDGTIKRTPDGGIQVKEGQTAAAQKELNDLDDLDVEALDIYFTVEELDGLNLSIADFNYMLPFIQE